MKEKLICAVLAIYCMSAVFAQDANLFYEKNGKDFELYVENNEHCPVSFEVNIDLNNMISTDGNNKVFVVPPLQKKFKITTLKPKGKGKYSFKYKSWRNYGDHYLKDFDKDFIYNLPYAYSKAYKVGQGYNGTRTHKGENALDFTMPEGTPIHAIRDGVVVTVVDENEKFCPDKICAKYNNKILVYHPDGTFAWYLHLEKNGALVKKGQKVKKGQLIAKSGNTGWTSGPHLHLEVAVIRIRSKETLKTKFKIRNGNKIVFLEEGYKYQRKYQ